MKSNLQMKNGEQLTFAVMSLGWIGNVSTIQSLITSFHNDVTLVKRAHRDNVVHSFCSHLSLTNVAELTKCPCNAFRLEGWSYSGFKHQI